MLLKILTFKKFKKKNICNIIIKIFLKITKNKNNTYFIIIFHIILDIIINIRLVLAYSKFLYKISNF